MKPRVLFLGPVPPPYMGPTLATEVILNSSLGDEYELIHLDTSDHRELDTLGALDFLNIYLALKFYADLTWKIIRHRPDLVYIPVAQTTVGYLKDSGFILISKVLGRRVICHLRGGNFQNWLSGSSALTRWYVKRIHGLVDGQIVLGECLKPLFSGILPVERLYVVPNGKDIELPKAPARPDDKVRLLFLANMRRTKGSLDVLHAAPLIAQQCPNAEIICYGAWSEPAVKDEIDRFMAGHPGLPIEFKGPIHGPAKYQVIQSSDIFVFPTYYPPEGHPWVIVEAMAAGLPVISTDQGAITESVVDGENGYIIEKQSPQALADKAITLIENPELRRAMGRSSRRIYAERFTEASMVENMAAAFQGTLES